MFKLKMKVNPMTIMAYVLILAALYMLMLSRPKPTKSVQFAEMDEEIVRERPVPAYAQIDPNSRMW